MKKLLLFSIFAVILSIAVGQKANLTTPQKTVEHHLKYLQDDNFHPELSAYALDTSYVKAGEGRKLAVKLKQIYDGAGYRVVIEDIPNETNYLDSLPKNKQKYVVDPDFDEIYVRQTASGEWKYAAECVAKIDQVHKSVYPFGTHLLLDLFAKDGNDKIFGLYLYQYAGLLFIIIVCFVLHKIFTFLIDKVLIKFLRLRGLKAESEKYVLPTVKPFSLFLVFLLALILVPVLQLPVSFATFVIMMLKATLPVFWTIIFYRLIDVLSSFFEKVAERTESTLDDQLVPLLRKAFKVFVVIIGALITLQNLNINVTALLTGLSIGGIAFALAAQDMLKNFFGSLMIFIDKPFAIGDWVTGNGIDGDIEEVGFRSTRIRTFHNSLVSVPNGVIADMTIDNMGMRKYRRYKTYLAVTYDTPAEILDLFTEGIKELVRNHPACPSESQRPFHVYVNSFGESSIDILVYIFFEVPDWGAELKARHDFNLSIVELAGEMGVRFAFKTQTLHIEEFPEKKSSTPLKGNIDAIRTQMKNYLNKRKS